MGDGPPKEYPSGAGTFDYRYDYQGRATTQRYSSDVTDTSLG